MSSRRDLLRTLAASGVTAGTGGLLGACARPADWCETPEVLDDGPYPYPESCPQTASQTEGPFYLADAPERVELDLHGDEGTPLTLDGQIFTGDCDTPAAGAVVEFWHADPSGDYDNKSDDMRYRCAVTTDEEGRFSLATLLPGRYLNGTAYRPRHIHVKVFDADGNERLTTQLYFEGDPYIECDALANTSLVLPFEGSEDTQMTCEDVWLVV